MFSECEKWFVIILTISCFKYNHSSTVEREDLHRISERNIVGQSLRGKFFAKLKLNLTTRQTFYTKTKPIQLKNYESLVFSDFDQKQKTIFIIPGWQSSNNIEWALKMKTELLLNNNFNIFDVIWADYATNVYYPQAVYDVKGIGIELSTFINYLEQDFGYPLANVYLIGFSLGAHIAGFTGSALEGKIGRITGLDPAGPTFRDEPIEKRLDPSDAAFVDVIHTNSGCSSYGTTTKSGHIDFYPNGGSEQPGCGWKFKLNMILGPRDAYKSFQNKSLVLGCNHRRAHDYYTESINSPCKFLASLCSNYKDFVKNRCAPCLNEDAENCKIMGFYARWNHQYTAAYGFYLKTNDNSPFCIRNSYGNLNPNGSF